MQVQARNLCPPLNLSLVMELGSGIGFRRGQNVSSDSSACCMETRGMIARGAFVFVVRHDVFHVVLVNWSYLLQPPDCGEGSPPGSCIIFQVELDVNSTDDLLSPSDPETHPLNPNTPFHFDRSCALYAGVCSPIMCFFNYICVVALWADCEPNLRVRGASVWAPEHYHAHSCSRNFILIQPSSARI